MLLNNAALAIIKIGSSLLVDTARKPRSKWMKSLAADIAALRAKGTKVILVSSGAVALGRKQIATEDRTLTLNEKQAAAACGQPLLMATWQKAFATQNLHTAQILLTQNDTEIRRSYLNARNTLLTLLESGIIPIINENDTVATTEIRYGDNDRLAARIAQMASADALILLSDIDGLYTANPHTTPSAKHLFEVAEITPAIEAMAGGAQVIGVGSGGMITKIEAAKIAVKSGCATYLCNGKALNPITALLGGATHTIFHSRLTPLSARKQWISGGIHPAGTATIDAGAAVALTQGKSLLFAGVTKLMGEFAKGDLLAVVTQDNKLIAKGLSNYDSREAVSLVGKRSQELPENSPAELIHRDNLVLEN